MPIYEYQCQACETVVEELQKISDAPLKKCPECGKNKLLKLVSAPSFRLSGTGWYETDFKTDSDKKRNLASDDSSGDSQKESLKVDKKKSASGDGDKTKDTKSKSENKDNGKKAAPSKPKAKSKKSK